MHKKDKLSFILLVLVLVCCLSGAGYRTTNFITTAPTQQLAKEIGDAAEYWRTEMAVLWTGEPMPNWGKPCPLSASVGPELGAGGATSFRFDNGEVFDWTMRIQGSRERVIDSVLPHEVTHTVFACYFREPLPRWADEGACSQTEAPEERAKSESQLEQFFQQRRTIPFSTMLYMKEYPQDVMPLYAQGYSVCGWLIKIKGRAHFMAFIKDGLKDEDWKRAVQAFYGYNTPMEMQEAWLVFIRGQR